MENHESPVLGGDERLARKGLQKEDKESLREGRQA